ncbi:MAG: cobalamin-dependent protein [Chitinispirillaceae bacterium]|nr:cobalamin-dependent protein [Chitinispirillaceae bacterium]
MEKVDCLLVKPGSQKRIYGALSDFNLTAIEPPLWGAILAGYLRGRSYSVVLLDAEVEGWSYEETAKKIDDIDPLLAVIVVSGSNPSASTWNMNGATEILACLRDSSPGMKTLLFGLHPSALPKRTLCEAPVDFVCQGEGFVTLPALLDALKQRETERFAIPGLWYKKNGVAVGNPRPPLLSDLDSLPRPAWDLLPMKSYRAHTWHCFGDIAHRQPYAVLYTNLGCPFSCTFCCINALFGTNTIRYRGGGAVVDELDFLATTCGVRNIKIIDEMFAINETRVIELCDRIIERRYDLNIWAYARVNTVTERMLEKMRAAGITWLAYGFESGSKRVIDDVSKGYRTELVHKVVDMSYAMGFHICANYIFGLPEDDYDTMTDTLKLSFDINAEWANIYCAMAYPGSRLHDMAMENRWPLPETWNGYSQYAVDCLPLPTRYLAGGQVLAFRDYAFTAYYTNPRYLAMIDRKFGPETVSHIIDMASKKIERRYARLSA